MKRAKFIVIITLLLVLVFPVLSVSADDEPVDWSTVDWATFDFNYFAWEERGQYNTLREWLLTEADMQTLYEYARRVDGFYADDFGNIIRSRFLQEPVECLVYLENEEPFIQKFVVCEIYYTAIYEDDSSEFISVLENILIDKETNPQAFEFLKEIITGAEELSGISITNPQTGDSFLWAPLGLLFSAAGLVFTKRKLAI